MFDFQPKRKIGGLSEELSSEPAAKNRPFVGSVSNSELIQLLSGSASDDPDSPNTGSSQNTSGVPAGLKAKYEQLSGVSMDDVSVHYNSDKPIQYGALAYTQGNDVYLGPGQEQHLGHELGHVIQQKQGRVPVTGSVGGAPLNDDPSLEHEADSLLSGNSPVQHITAGYHPDSGAPIQRLRINLSGDGDDGDPVTRNLQYYNIPTGGGRLFVPNSKKEEVKKTVTDYQAPLAIHEDIVFEGHGVHSKGETTVRSLQDFRPKELAEMAASIPKPENWQGKIILFGCRAGDIAPQVAEGYYNITRQSVTVVGAKETICSINSSLDPSHIVVGFEDPEKRAALEIDPNFQLLEQIKFGFRGLFCLFADLLHWLTYSSLVQKQKAISLLNYKSIQILLCMDELDEKIRDAPDDFWEHYPNLKANLASFPTLYQLVNNHCRGLYQAVSSPESADETIQFHTTNLSKLIDETIILGKEIYNEFFQECATTFKSGLDFDDKEMMVSATYTAEDEWTERALPELMDLFG